MQLNKGITLIELMIVVSIVSILAMVVVPSYTSSVRRSARTEARAILYNVAQIQERYFTSNNTYLCFNSTGCTTTPAGWQNYSGSSYANRKYDIKASSRTGTVLCTGETQTNTIANSYIITATPANGYSDAECGTLTLDSCGTRGNSAGTVANCWK